MMLLWLLLLLFFGSKKFMFKKLEAKKCWIQNIWGKKKFKAQKKLGSTIILENVGKFWSKKIRCSKKYWVQKNFGFQKFGSTNFGIKKNLGPKTFCNPKNLILSRPPLYNLLTSSLYPAAQQAPIRHHPHSFHKPSIHLTDTLQTPSKNAPDTLQIPSRNLPDTLKISFKQPPDNL